METEEELRQSEILRTKEDYLELLELLNESSQNIEGNQLDEVVNDVSKGLRSKIGLILHESERYLKPQSWWSKLLGRHKKKKEEKKIAKEQRIIQKNESKKGEDDLSELKQNLEEYNQRISKLQGFLESKGIDISTLLAPPRDSEAKIPEVVGNDVQGSEEQNEESSTDYTDEDGCMQF